MGVSPITSTPETTSKTHKVYLKGNDGAVVWPITAYDAIVGMDSHMDDFIDTVTKSVGKADGEGSLWIKKPDNPAVGDILYTKDANGYDVMEWWDGAEWVPIISTADLHKVQGEVDAQTSDIDSLASSAAAIADLANSAVTSAFNANEMASAASSAVVDVQASAASATASAQSAAADATTAMAQAQVAQSSAADAIATSKVAQSSAEQAITASKSAQSDAASALATANGASSDVVSLKKTVDENTATIDTLATQKSVDTLSGTVTTLSTDVSQNAKDIKSKADSTVVDTINETVTNQGTLIDQNAKEIKLKADSSTVDKLNGSVSALSAQVNTQAGQISLMASKTDIAGMATQSYVQAQTKIVSDSITSTVSTVQSSLNSLDGTNLLLHTYDYDGWATNGAVIDDTYSGTKVFQTGVLWGGPKYHVTDLNSRGVINTTDDFTFSAWVRNTSEANVPIAIYCSTGNDTYITRNDAVPVKLGAKSDWQRIFVTFKFTNITANTLLRFEPRLAPTNGYIQFAGQKLERGSVPTGYSPAPEDTATVTALTSLSQTVDRLSGLITDNQGKITSLQATINGVQTTVSDQIKGVQTQQTTLANQYTSVVGTLNSIGKRNLLKNSEFDGLTGWQGDSDYKIGLVDDGTTSGTLEINVNTTGWPTLYQKLSTLEVASVSLMVFLISSSGKAYCGLGVDFLDTAGKRINALNSFADVTKLNQWQTLKMENLTPPSGTKTIKFEISSYGNVHALVQRPMMVFSNSVETYNASQVSESEFIQTQSDINLRVKTNDVINQINISKESILIDGKKVHITGTTTIDNGVIKNAMIADATISGAKIVDASILSAKIANLDGSKIVANSITADKLSANAFQVGLDSYGVGWNLTPASLSFISDASAKASMVMDLDGVEYYSPKDGTDLGGTGVSQLGGQSDPTYMGLQTSITKSSQYWSILVEDGTDYWPAAVWSRKTEASLGIPEGWSTNSKVHLKTIGPWDTDDKSQMNVVRTKIGARWSTGFMNSNASASLSSGIAFTDDGACYLGRAGKWYNLADILQACKIAL